jgi:hypothetical protein
MYRRRIATTTQTPKTVTVITESQVPTTKKPNTSIANGIAHSARKRLLHDRRSNSNCLDHCATATATATRCDTDLIRLGALLIWKPIEPADSECLNELLAQSAAKRENSR